MTFVRLAGCNASDRGLDCVRWCDTPGSWDPTAGQLVDAVEVAAGIEMPRACLTGGEPLLQAEAVGRLGLALQARSVSVHVESNGTLPLPLGFKPDWLTVSPKPPRYEVHSGLGGVVDELKIVVDASFGAEAETVVEVLAGHHAEAVVSLQPEAGGGAPLVRRATASVLAHPTWRLSLQLHKLLGIR